MKNLIKLFFAIAILLSCNNSKKKEKQTFNEIVTQTNTESIPVKDEPEIETILDTEITNEQNKQAFIQNSNTEIGIINDLDGYTNLRLAPTTSSKILKRIKENEYFFFNKIEPSDWFKVKDLYGFVGYTHKSRVKPVDNDNLFNVSFIDYSEKGKKEKDSIILLKDLDVFFEINFQGASFNYDEFGLKTVSDSSAIYADDETEIKISKAKFEPEKHQLEYHKEYKDFAIKIDGYEFWGTDGGKPIFKISEIKITQNQGVFIIPNKNIKDLFQPNLKYVSAYKTKDNRIIMNMSNSDGAGAYTVIFIVKNKKLLKRIVYLPF